MKRWGLPLGVLLVALGIAGGVSLFASEDPDGLERVAETRGFAERARAQPGDLRVMPEYELPGRTQDPLVGRVLPRVAGTLAVFALCLGVALLLRRRRPPPAGP